MKITKMMLLAMTGTMTSTLIADQIAVADPVAIVRYLPSMESLEKDLNKEIELAQSKMNNKKVQLEAKIQEYEASKDTISEQKAQKLRKEIHGIQRELKYLEAELREDLGLMQQEINGMLLSQANDAISQYAKSHKIDFVFRNSQDFVLYAPDAKDITTAVIETLVAKDPKAAAAAPAKQPAKQAAKEEKKK